MNSANNGKRVLALGVGGAGCHIIRCLKAIAPDSGLYTAVIDTDSMALKDHPADFQLAASSDWNLRIDSGCGGDIIRGERAIARVRKKIIDLLSGYDMVVITAGLGGGTATGGLRTVASVLRELGTPSILMLTLPFLTENYGRRKNAEDCLNELICFPNVVLPLPNDLLYTRLPPETPAAQAMSLANAEMASTVAGIANLLKCSNFAGSDYGIFLNVLNKHKTNCAVGIGKSTDSSEVDRTVSALQKVMDSPFLGGLETIREADAAIVILSGGSKMTLAEMKRSMEQCTALFNRETEVLTGINTNDADPDFFQLAVITIKYDESDPKSVKMRKRPAAASAKAAKASQAAIQEEGLPLFQGELGLTSLSRGVFAKFPTVKYKDEDLDIPTFQRRSLHIDKGD